MKGILADINIQGHVDLLVAIMRAEPWKLFWDYLQIRYLHFADVGLVESSPDSEIWKICQEQELVLITANRNQDDPDSLETTIRNQNTATSLPVLTIGNIPHLRHSRDYAHRVIDKLLASLMEMENLRGTGRLYLP